MAHNLSEANEYNPHENGGGKDEYDQLEDVDYLHSELAHVNRKLEVLHLALEKARSDHKVVMETRDKNIQNMQEKLAGMQETVERLTYEKERLYSKGKIRECDMSQLKREVGLLKMQLEEAQSKARERTDVSAILLAQEKSIKEELKEELKEEMDKNAKALHEDMVAILKEVKSEKEGVTALLDELHSERNGAENKTVKEHRKDLHLHKSPIKGKHKMNKERGPHKCCKSDDTVDK